MKNAQHSDRVPGVLNLMLMLAGETPDTKIIPHLVSLPSPKQKSPPDGVGAK